MAENDICSIGLVLSEVGKCNHSTTVNKEEKQLIYWRSSVPVDQFLTTCMLHKSKFLVKYIFYQTKCCDPFKLHTKPRKGELMQNSKTYSNTPDDNTEPRYSKTLT